jgi:hypothetical protein
MLCICGFSCSCLAFLFPAWLLLPRVPQILLSHHLLPHSSVAPSSMSPPLQHRPSATHSRGDTPPPHRTTSHRWSPTAPRAPTAVNDKSSFMRRALASIAATVHTKPSSHRPWPPPPPLLSTTISSPSPIGNRINDRLHESDEEGGHVIHCGCDGSHSTLSV